MRCVAGDRAAIVGGYKDNIGHLVNVREAHAHAGYWTVEILGSCIARHKGELVVLAPGALAAIHDKHLWPLRDGPWHDETLLRGAGMPFDKRFRRVR